MLIRTPLVGSTMESDPRFVFTIVSVLLLIFLIYFVRNRLHRRLKGIKGYGRFLHLVTLAIIIGIVAEVGYVWGVFELLVGSITAAGALGVVFAWGTLPLITDMVSGILIHLDRDIDVGVDVEIDGKRGVIEEISLTRTKILNHEYTMLVPNRRFRESVVIIRPILSATTS